MAAKCSNCRYYDPQYKLCQIILPQHIVVKHDTSDMAMGFDNATDPDYCCALHKKVKPDGIQSH